MQVNNINNYNFDNNYSLAFGATKQQYQSAVKYLKSQKRAAVRMMIGEQFRRILDGIKYHYPWAILKKRIHLNPFYYVFSNTMKADNLSNYGIKTLNVDKLDGIQYGIDVFNDLSMREILFVLYKTVNLAVSRGCNNMCEHCFLDAKPADKSKLNSMPYEDFEKISNGFTELNERINKTLKNKNKNSLIGKLSNSLIDGRFPASMTALFYDSDGMSILLKDKNGKEYDFVDLSEMFTEATGKHMLFDTAGWNPKNKKMQERAEKYAEYFARPYAKNKVEQVNLSVNTFNPLYTKAYKLGYRSGAENDLSNPDIKLGKQLYDRYINKIANMLVTFRDAKTASLLMTFSTDIEKNMEGYYFSDLEKILSDVEKRCIEILKEKYPKKADVKKELVKITNIKKRAIDRYKNDYYDKSRFRNVYAGRYIELLNSKNSSTKTFKDKRYTSPVSNINVLSDKEYQRFFENYESVIDTNGNIYYYQYDNDISIRPLGKKLNISTNGKDTAPLSGLESRP